MNTDALIDLRTSSKLRWFAMTSLAIGVAGSIDPVVGYLKDWGVLPGGRGQHSQGLLGLLLAIGALGLLFRRNWGRVLVAFFFGFVILFCIVAGPLHVLSGNFLPAGLLALLAAPAILAFRFLGSAPVLVLTAGHEPA